MKVTCPRLGVSDRREDGVTGTSHKTNTNNYEYTLE